MLIRNARLGLVRTHVLNVLEKTLSEGSRGGPTKEFLCFRDAGVDTPEITSSRLCAIDGELAEGFFEDANYLRYGHEFVASNV